MIQNILSTIIGISLLIFSSYKGNDPKIADFSYYYTKNDLDIQFKLKDAFDNDFLDFFKSTIPIKLIFRVKILRSDNTVLLNKDYVYKINYNPFLRKFEYKIMNKSLSTNSYKELIEEISQFRLHLAIHNPELLRLSIDIFPDKIQLKDKTFDLKLLWKNKILKIKRNLIPRLYEN